MSLDVDLSALRVARVYEANITNNLVDMAKAAEIYMYLWCPGELGITKAAQLTGPLTEGLLRLLKTPDRFKDLNPANGWGSYDTLVKFVRAYRDACEENQDADIGVSS